jgi:hypothetical protein
MDTNIFIVPMIESLSTLSPRSGFIRTKGEHHGSGNDEISAADAAAHTMRELLTGKLKASGGAAGHRSSR